MKSMTLTFPTISDLFMAKLDKALKFSIGFWVELLQSSFDHTMEPPKCHRRSLTRSSSLCLLEKHQRIQGCASESHQNITVHRLICPLAGGTLHALRSAARGSCAVGACSQQWLWYWRYAANAAEYLRIFESACAALRFLDRQRFGTKCHRKLFQHLKGHVFRISRLWLAFGQCKHAAAWLQAKMFSRPRRSLTWTLEFGHVHTCSKLLASSCLLFLLVQHGCYLWAFEMVAIRWADKAFFQQGNRWRCSSSSETWLWCWWCFLLLLKTWKLLKCMVGVFF